MISPQIDTRTSIFTTAPLLGLNDGLNLDPVLTDSDPVPTPNLNAELISDSVLPSPLVPVPELDENLAPQSDSVLPSPLVPILELDENLAPQSDSVLLSPLVPILELDENLAPQLDSVLIPSPVIELDDNLAPHLIPTDSLEVSHFIDLNAQATSTVSSGVASGVVSGISTGLSIASGVASVAASSKILRKAAFTSLMYFAGGSIIATVGLVPTLVVGGLILMS